MFEMEIDPMLLICMGCAAFLVFCFVMFYVSIVRRVRKIQNKGVTTTGTITSTRHHSRHRSHNYATITFLTEDGTEITAESPLIYSKSPYRVGENVEVSYLPRKPHVFVFGRVEEYFSYHAGDCFLCSALAVGAALFTYFQGVF